MSFLRRGIVRKLISTFLILLLLDSILVPNYVKALTTGPHQPEYIAYTEPGSSDMVNLLTGDFSFNLPVLEVPGPEGSFSLPLGYGSGINLDQEASWVGLGWSLNAGAITRTVNEFPDDANGESQTITVKDLTGLRGWNSAFMGVGRMGWNNQIGHYGSMSLLGLVNAAWSEDHSSVGVIGINVTDDGVRVDPMQLGMGIITIASFGAAGAAAGAGSMAGNIAKQVAISATIGVASDQLSLLVNGSNTPKTGSGGFWEYSKRERNHWGLKAMTGHLIHVKEYKIWLDKTRTEKMYGTLYIGNATTTSFTQTGHATVGVKNGGVTQPVDVFSNANNEGSASDINFQSHPNDDLKQYYQINNPASIATDNFSVKASGVSGSIVPYRLDVGAVAMPRQMTKYHDRFAPVKFLANNSSYKVPFVYNGQLSNAYYHHVGAAASVTSPTFYFGLNTILGSAVPTSNSSITYDINDVVLNGQRVRTDVNTYKKIPQSHYIEWLTNDEIRNNMTYSSRFMDYFSGGTGTSVSPTSDRHLFRTNLPIGRTSVGTYTSSLSGTIPINSSDIGKFGSGDVADLNISFYNDANGAGDGTTSDYQTFTGVTVTGVTVSPPSITVNDSRLFSYYGKFANIDISLNKSPQNLSSIGGFCITGVDGTTFHFALPIYDYEMYSEVADVADPINKKSIISRPSPTANTWLLTGITGSDFIDRNSNGMIDDTDWGHWVKLNYGSLSNDYQWRLPYANNSYSLLPGDTHKTYTKGKKQMYYLNSIETRSHTALFIKDYRTDSRSANTSPQNPLKLDEIVLIKKEHYQKLVATVAQGGFGLTDFSNKTNFLFNTQTASVKTFLDQNCLKRVKFNLAYDLTQGTPNSSSGKLTLKKLSIYGRNSVKIVPDYIFDYANNPAYNINNWDAFGMYNSQGTASAGGHAASSVETDGSAWSLTKITTPQGAEINVNYERDTYYSVSGYTFCAEGPSFSNLNFDVYYPTGFPITRVTVNNPAAYMEVGDSVNVAGYATYRCSPSPTTQNKTFSKNARIVGMGSNYIDIGTDYMGLSCSLSSGQFIHFDAQAGQIVTPFKNRKGGDIRVGSIAVKDEFGNENKIRYLYKNPDGTSSGVIATLPVHLNSCGYDVSYYLGYPQTPVLYKRVTVLGGKLSDDNDYYSKHIYEFETPHYSQYTLTQNVVKNAELIRDAGAFVDYQSIYSHKFEDRSSAIGRLKSIKIYDQAGGLYASTTLNYTEQLLNNGTNNYQGIYTKGAIMFDRVSPDGSFFTKYHKINRTTTIQYPSVVQKIVKMKDGLTSQSENISWDLYTGGVLEKLAKSPLGLTIKSVVKPAYTVYPELGSRGLNPANKNMLSQSAAEYTYRADGAGNVIGLLSATATRWEKNWTNYRIYNSGTQTYSSGAESDAVWRIKDSYAWKGDLTHLKSDGTFTFTLPGDDFNFTTPGLVWQKTGELSMFDHYGMPLESRDLNGLPTAVKMGYGERFIVATASNAEYNEIAFCGAEDLQTDKPFFGGEVALGSGSVFYKHKGQLTTTNTGDANITQAHTGDALIALTTGYGFVFKPTGLKPNRKYRASVWTNKTIGRIYYKLNGAAEVLSVAPVKQAGFWYLTTVEIPIGGSFTSLEVGVKSSSGAKVVFDDFRFQPVDAFMTAKVVDPLIFEFGSIVPRYEYLIDNNNLGTKYEYDQKGYLKAVYAESTKPGVSFNGFKKISEGSNDFRRNNVNQ